MARVRAEFVSREGDIDLSMSRQDVTSVGYSQLQIVVSCTDVCTVNGWRT